MLREAQTHDETYGSIGTEPLRIEVIDRVYAAVLASKTPAERVTMADAAHRGARTMIQNRLLQLYPEWTDEQRHRE
jgi:hypothetical protein